MYGYLRFPRFLPPVHSMNLIFVHQAYGSTVSLPLLTQFLLCNLKQVSERSIFFLQRRYALFACSVSASGRLFPRGGSGGGMAPSVVVTKAAFLVVG